MAGKNVSHPQTLVQALSLAVLLVAYGNASSYLVGYLGLALPGNMLFPNLLSTVLLLLWARRGARLSAEDLGVRRQGALRSGLWGMATGAIMATPAVLALAFPLLPVPVTYPEIAGLEPPRLLWRLLLELPLATALCEELAFRGVLQAMFARYLSTMPAVIATNVTFTLWHVVVTYRTMVGTSLGSTALAPLAVVTGLAGVLVGGIIFSVLRLRSGNLAGCVVAHWLVDALMIVTVYARG